MGYLNLYIVICPTDINMPYMGRLARLGRRGRRVNKSRQYKGKRTARLAKPVRRAIKQIINKQQERKYRASSYTRLLNSSCNVTQNEMFNCMVDTQQAGAGTASSSQRIGQKVTVARCYSDFTVTFAPGVASSKDLIVKLWVLTSKELKNYDDIAAWGTVGNRPLPISFLNDGNGGTTNPQGLIEQLNLPVENETWTSQKEFVFRLTKSSGTLMNNPNGYAAAPPFGYVGTGGPCWKRMRVYHNVPKTLTYDGQLFGQFPNNSSPVWTLSYAYADGTAPNVGNVDIQVTVTNHLEFYDA